MGQCVFGQIAPYPCLLTLAGMRQNGAGWYAGGMHGDLDPVAKYP